MLKSDGEKVMFQSHNYNCFMKHAARGSSGDNLMVEDSPVVEYVRM